jgi:hypothetical protein
MVAIQPTQLQKSATVKNAKTAQDTEAEEGT